MGNDTPLVTVIVPVYGVEKYLRQCIDSVLAQTFIDWELILVDDGSPDRCGEICDAYAAVDSRIKVIHSGNGGLSVARNRGIDISKGKFISFVDADDMVHPQYLDALYKAAVENDCAISCVGSKIFSGDLTGNTVIKKYRFETNGGIDYTADILYQKTGNNSVWGRLYRRELFEDIRFTPRIGYEDLDIIYRVLIRADRIAFSSDRLYYYRVNPSSYLGKFNERRADVLDVTDRMVSALTETCPKLAMAARSRRLSAYFNIYLLLAANGIKNGTLDKRCRDLIRRERGVFLFCPEIRMKNRIGIIASYILGIKGFRAVGRYLMNPAAR